ncbi:Gfo/Idh/MocA family oxidoreductase [Anaerolentibacter hominis]|uniref:Gfo/Idh/MocA family protein n=1 Tax=Anaerolentibacter hominis TaxID=3079009 RepID=UPI0031B82EFC
MDKIRLGILGMGTMGMKYAGMALSQETPEIELTAATASRDPQRQTKIEQFAQAGVQIFQSADALMDSGACDSVLIAVPHYLHCEMAIKAFQKGLHVLCDKPAGVYTKQVRQMNRAAEESGRVFGMLFNQRTNCVYRRIKELTESGSLGKLKRVNWIITDWYRPQAYYNSGTWRATWEGEGGGVLINQCPHQLDLLQWICGMPSRVRAFCHEGKWHSIEVEDDVTAYMEFPGGATGVFVTSTGDAPGTNRLELTYEMGKLVCEDDRLSLWKLEENERDFCRNAAGGFDMPRWEQSEVQTDGNNEQHVGVMNAFAASILHQTPLIAEGMEGINELMISNAMYLSSWTGETVELPLNEETFFTELKKKCGN